MNLFYPALAGILTYKYAEYKAYSKEGHICGLETLFWLANSIIAVSIMVYIDLIIGNPNLLHVVLVVLFANEVYFPLVILLGDILKKICDFLQEGHI